MCLSVAAGAAVRIWLALHDDGIAWPDEIYQGLEQAHRLVFNYGLIPWEFVDGARHWTFPAFVAFWLKLCQLAGVTDPRTYLTVVRLVFVACSLGAAVGTYLLARAHGARTTYAAAGAAACAWFAPSIYFSARALSENAAALCVVVGFALTLRRADGRRWHTAAGAALTGLAVFFRLACVPWAVALLVILAARRDYRRAIEATATLALCAVVFGWVDHLTWAAAPGARFGGWFHSAVVYFRFNVIEGRAADWGTSPWWYYLHTLFRGAPAVMTLAAIAAAIAVRRATGLTFAIALFAGVHMALPHKELRFILPALPVFFALAAIGLDAVAASSARRAFSAAVLVAALVSLAGFHRLTFADVGQYPGRDHESAYDDSGPVNRLLLAARKRSSLCGISVAGLPIAWTGGYSYLHRRVPLFAFERAPLERRWVNHVIAPASQTLPGEIVATDGAWVLRALPIERCVAPSPPFGWHL